MHLVRAKEKRKKKERQRNRDESCMSGKELWRRKTFHTLGSPLTGGDGGWGALESQTRAQQQGCREKSREIPSQRIGADQHSPAWDTCRLTHQGGWGLGAEAWAWASEVRPQGEDQRWLPEDSLNGASVPQLVKKGSGKKAGPAGEARDHCFRVHKERDFLLHVPTDGRALPKWTPEMGTSCSYHLGPQRWTWTATAAAAATKGPVCKHRSLSTPSWEPVKHTTARVLWSRANFSLRTHSVPQTVETLPPQALHAAQLWLQYSSLSLA